MTGRLLIPLLLAVCAACGDARRTDPCAGKHGAAGTRDVAIVSGARSRSFRLVVPDSAVRGEPAPLVLLFHGSNGDGEKEIAVTGLDRKAAAEGFVLAAGDGIDRSWNSGFCRDPAGRACVADVDDVAFARDVVAAVERDVCIDPTRVYATGFSKGAAMVFRLACEASDVFSAFAPVAGALTTSPCAPGRPRAILIVSNAQDAAAPAPAGRSSFEAFLRFNGCGDATPSDQPTSGARREAALECADDATTAFCLVDGGHRWPGGATEPDAPFRATDAVWGFFASLRPPLGAT
ncbi:MAG TPA: PHB depolymerase family esterase [Candidatus Binatia bacterium]|nr:PHB depolymerase family esterase [Candidatus Binatia bacterium]